MKIEARNPFARPEPVSLQTAPKRAPLSAQAEETRKDEKVPGVLRNVADGHYRGVADVRLRIVFHDELAALEAERDGAARADRLATLATDVGARIGEALASGDLSEEQAAGIEEARSTLLAGPLAAPAQGLEAALAEFVDTVRGSFTEGEAGTEGLASLAGDLQAMLERAQADLAEAEGTSALPPLSEPAGTGAAYAKFLAIYAELQAAGEAEAAPPVVDAVG